VRIFIIGYMGSGKTTVGKNLAQRLKFCFIDMDTFIEQKYHRTISNYFEADGEEKFREIEHLALKEIIKLENIVVATGGGTPCFYDNMDQMNRQGITIYLKMEVQALANRLKNNQSKRPLIKGKTQSQLIEYITKTLAERKKYYQKSHYTIETINLNTTELVKQISGI